LAPLSLVQWRAAHEEIALDLSAARSRRGDPAACMVYGEHRGILGGWFAEALDHHTVTYPATARSIGAWCTVTTWRTRTRSRSSTGYRRTLPARRRIPAHGERTGRAVATATGESPRVVPEDDLIPTHGAFGEALLNDLQVSSARGPWRELGWVPRHLSFVAEADDLWRELQAARPTHVR
jgi:hypothetical protein